jgi:hypothetical protein
MGNLIVPFRDGGENSDLPNFVDLSLISFIVMDNNPWNITIKTTDICRIIFMVTTVHQLY